LKPITPLNERSLCSRESSINSSAPVSFAGAIRRARLRKANRGLKPYRIVLMMD
jgi:hypothetical protein